MVGKNEDNLIYKIRIIQYEKKQLDVVYPNN